jgi:hypothetical protein
VLLVYGLGLAPFDTLVWSEQKAANEWSRVTDAFVLLSCIICLSEQWSSW